MKEILNNQVIPHDIGDGWRIDIVVLNDSFQSWIYHKDYGVKTLMFGVDKRNTTYKDFCKMVETNFPEYQTDYVKEYMQ